MSEPISDKDYGVEREPFSTRFAFVSIPEDASPEVRTRFEMFNRAIFVINAVDVWNEDLQAGGRSYADRFEEIVAVNSVIDIARSSIAKIHEMTSEESIAEMEDLLAQIPLGDRQVQFDQAFIVAGEEEMFHRLDHIFHDVGPKAQVLYLLSDEDEEGKNRVVLENLDKTLRASVDTINARFPHEQLGSKNRLGQSVDRQLKDINDNSVEHNITYVKLGESVDLQLDLVVEYSRVRFGELVENIVSNAEKAYTSDGVTEKADRIVTMNIIEFVSEGDVHYVDFEFGNITNIQLSERMKREGFKIGESDYRKAAEAVVEPDGTEVTGTGVAMGTNRQILQEEYHGDLLIREDEDVDGKGHRGIVVTVRLPVVIPRDMLSDEQLKLIPEDIQMPALHIPRDNEPAAPQFYTYREMVTNPTQVEEKEKINTAYREWMISQPDRRLLQVEYSWLYLQHIFGSNKQFDSVEMYTAWTQYREAEQRIREDKHGDIVDMYWPSLSETSDA